MKYVCELCGMIYDEDMGYPKKGIAPGTEFADLPEDFECPGCYSERQAFSPVVRRQPGPTAAVQRNDTFWRNAKYSDGKQESER